MTVQVLVDADNVVAARLELLLDALTPYDVVMTVAGHADAVGALDWPAAATVIEADGWQRADLVLASAYVPEPGPLVIASGDGDFGLLATRHPGPVLVVSEAASGRLRDVATVIDPATEGSGGIVEWLRAVSSE
jgi:hypothetical protein